MPKLTYAYPSEVKPLVWLSTVISTPPLSDQARKEAGLLLRQIQKGVTVTFPSSRPMPSIGARCHELRIQDRNDSWRIIYRIESDAILILDSFSKKSQRTPGNVIVKCRARLASYLAQIR